MCVLPILQLDTPLVFHHGLHNRWHPQVMVPVYLVRTSMMNANYPLQKSILMVGLGWGEEAEAEGSCPIHSHCLHSFVCVPQLVSALCCP